MEVAMEIWSAGLFFLAGLAIGRIKWSRLEDEGKEAQESEVQESEVQEREMKIRKSVPGEKRIPLGWSVGSPVSGSVSYFDEGGRKGAMIDPQQGILYAPAAGKIIRLYPTGNAMRLRTDYGVELLIQAGVGTGELETRYYRPRVVKNEVVNKGKPLLEFDVEGIRKEGYDPSVRLSVEDAQSYEDVAMCEVSQVKAGENLMWVQQ